MASGKIIVKDGGNVYIKFSHRSVPALVSTPEKISAEDIDKNKKELQLLGTAPNAKAINKRLLKLDYLYRTVLNEFLYKPIGTFTVADLKSRCIELADWKETPVIRDESSYWKIAFEKWKEYRADHEGATPKTIFNYNSTQTVFEDFIKETTNEYIGVLAITSELLNSFVQQLISEKRENSTIVKHIGIMRRFCCHYKHPVIDKDWKPARKLSIIKKQTVGFTADEIKKLYNYQPEPVYQPIKELLFRFIVTGVRWSDQDMSLLHKHGGFLKKRNKKNKELSHIPLSDYLIEILNKPKPEMSVKHFNKYVKKLCEKAGIDTPTLRERAPNGEVKEEYVPKWQLISSKIGRKSMVSLLEAAGLTRSEIRAVIGNSDEIEAYENVDLGELQKKAKEAIDNVFR